MPSVVLWAALTPALSSCPLSKYLFTAPTTTIALLEDMPSLPLFLSFFSKLYFLC